MPRVIVIGGANVDIKGRTSDAYVPGTSNPGQVKVSVGGVGRNIAENLARLGLAASLLTVLGEDANGRLIREASLAAGIDMALAITGPSVTGTYLAVLNASGEMVSAVSDMRNIEWLGVHHLEAAASALANAAMIVADCNLSAACLQWLCTFASRNALRLLIEPVSVAKARKLLEFQRPAPVFAITPNRQQLEALADEADPETALLLLHDRGFANIVVHMGGEGALCSSNGNLHRVPALGVNAVADVTGAGDAAVAGFVCGILAGRSLPDSARLGQAAASIKLASFDSVSSELNRDRVFALAGFS